MVSGTLYHRVNKKKCVCSIQEVFELKSTLLEVLQLLWFELEPQITVRGKKHAIT